MPRPERPRVAFDPAGPEAVTVRRWLLQLGAEPVATGTPDAAAVAPQHPGVTRRDVERCVRALTGGSRDRDERFDDHGSAQAWPRGTF